MNQLLRIIFILLIIFSVPNEIFGQKIIQNDKFTYVPVVDGRAVLIKEITLSQSNTDRNYSILKEWIKKNYTTDILNSSIQYFSSTLSISVNSKVELLLPILNANNLSEKAVMKYHLDVFIQNNKCIFQVSDITYKVENAIPRLKKRVPAENFVTTDALKTKDQYSKEKIETQKSTLYYFNTLADDLARDLNSSSPAKP